MLNDERDVDFAARGNHMTRVLVRGAAHGPTYVLPTLRPRLPDGKT